MGQDGAGPLPVYLLTGFLGSGKTTLLGRAVHAARFADTAVIINEFGEVGLDHVLVGQSTDKDVVLLDSGCLCCATSGTLAESLESLYYRRLRGEIPAFARVVVETSGLADPGPLINALGGDALLARHYRFAGVLATVDAVHGLRTLSDYREASAQVALADRLVVTKAELVEPAALQAVCAELRLRNPVAALHVRRGETDAEASAALFDALQHEARAEPVPQAAPAGPLAHVFRYGITSHVRYIPTPVGWPQYAAWVKLMQREMGERLLRAKGILRFEGGQPHAIHGVHHLFGPPLPLEAPVPQRQLGALVLIVQDASSDEIDQCLAPLYGR